MLNNKLIPGIIPAKVIRIAKIAMANLERLKNNVEVTQLPLTKYSF